MDFKKQKSLNIILKYFIIFSIIGALGNYIALIKKDKQNRKKWWLKYFTYIIWAGLAISGITYLNKFYFWMACAVCSIGFYEILKNLNKLKFKEFLILAFYIIISNCFIGFSSISNREVLLGIFVTICIFDAFCQITGQIFGKLKIIKKISPQKTLEGYIGGTIISLLFVFLALKNILLNEQWNIIIYFIIIGSVIGDILSSMLKRYMRIKDFSQILPGQGGVLDRYDSHIFTGVLYFCFNLIT